VSGRHRSDQYSDTRGIAGKLDNVQVAATLVVATANRSGRDESRPAAYQFAQAGSQTTLSQDLDSRTAQLMMPTME
jgi:hypothetical protein